MDPSFSAETRRHNLERLAVEPFDVLVIGGGITGAGIAHAAALNGYKTALVEKDDFASGTSSKSSKLVHGGFRYVANGDWGLVHQACAGRRALLQTAPGLVWPMPFVLPVYADSPYSLNKIRLGMGLYDAFAEFHNVQPPQMWSARRALAQEPLLRAKGLAGAARYYDAGTDDARLTLAEVRAAHGAGAVVVNHAAVTALHRRGCASQLRHIRTRTRIAGAQVRDALTGAEIEVRAQVVISAVGPWTDLWLKQAGLSESPRLRLTKGAHIIVPRECAPTHAAITLTAPDGRTLFVIPWGAYALIGTTDTDFNGNPDEAHATRADVAYILAAARCTLPGARLAETDVLSAQAGVRPLVRSGGEGCAEECGRTSRRHCIREVLPGLLTVAGGKLTIYREMARDTLKAIARQATPTAVPAQEPSRPQGAVTAPAPFSASQPQATIEAAQVVYAVQHEMALTLADVLARRTHLLDLAPDQGIGAAQRVAETMRAELQWMPAQTAEQLADYHRLAARNNQWRTGANPLTAARPAPRPANTLELIPA